jgi:hypothetical protein
MDIFYRRAFFNYYKWFFWTIVFAALFFLPFYSAIGTILLDNTCYRTNLAFDTVGDWDDPTIWEQYNGTAWVAALDFPDRDDRVFIGNRNEVRLTKNEQVKDLYLFAETLGGIDPGPKLNLQAYELLVYGQLHSISEDTGDFIYHHSTSGITDWIYPETGSIVIKGVSRTVVDRNSWSASNLNSRFGVVFDPDPGETLVVNAAMKANSFLIKSGTVRQTLNDELSPIYTSTFSFNIQDKFGTGDYGEFRILSGATLISEGTKAFNQIIRRTDSRPASSFVLEEGANLVLLGEEPIIDAVNVQLDGNVTYAGEGVSQEFLESSLTSSAIEFIYNHLFFSGVADKVLSPLVKVRGNMQFLDGGNVNGTSTLLVPTGVNNQQIAIPTFSLDAFEMDKSIGSVNFQNDLRILSAFSQLSGTIDFSGNSLFLDFGPTGIYSYSSGDWHNLNEVVYHHVPTYLDQSNALFPFYDSYLAFPRHLLLEGALGGTGASLSIRHVENQGVTYDPGFSDTDGSTVVYQLNSYFEISSSGGTSSEVDVWVLANDLGIQDIDHVRLTGDGEAATGVHLPASEVDGELWAGRGVVFNELLAKAFAIASISELSVLPLDWLDFEVLLKDEGVKLSWVNGRDPFIQYTVLRAEGPSTEFIPIGFFSGDDFGYQVIFQDQVLPENQAYWYYQVKAENAEGEVGFSPVIRFNNPLFSFDVPRIYPNPYKEGEVHVDLFGLLSDQQVFFNVWGSGGRLFLEGVFDLGNVKIQLEENLRILPTGSYFILLQTQNKLFRLRWLKLN